MYLNLFKFLRKHAKMASLTLQIDVMLRHDVIFECVRDSTIGIKHGFPCINVCQVPREMLKTEAVGRGFQHLPRDRANVNVLENHVWSLLLHKFNEKFVKIWEKYGTIVCHRLAVNEGKLIFFNIHLPGPRASNDSRWRSSVDSTSMFRKWQVGCCQTVEGTCKMR